MSRHLRYALILLGLATLSGCGANADTILRMGINRKSELTDRLAKVTDEQSAKKFNDVYVKNYVEANRQLDEKWQKWTKDIEDDLPRRDKIRIVNFKSSGAPGSDEWIRDARNVPDNLDPRVLETRESFIIYVKQALADGARFEREKARIANIVNYLVAEKTSQEKAGGNDNPSVDPKALCPNLALINDPTSRPMLLTGARKLPGQQ